MEIDYKQVSKDFAKLEKDIKDCVYKLWSLQFQKDVLVALLKDKPKKTGK